ncbi:MarR family winged helix-turn-helix transcriptional regulator [Nocardioides allogilvus]|uniref:MarR family winged helix-turn-helix transcriptional regulator n=1 Tax=Nocardioides allogilvus TaxID=2072017 RepID=UPI000D2FE3B4|nr:MarR family transcriptional regulator [Nocardioides allogilvus]
MSSLDRERTILDLEVEMAVLVRRIKRVISERAQAIHPDLTSTGYLVLAYMNEHGPVRASEVVDAFNLDKGAVSRLVQTVVDLGLVSKERDPDDGRAWVVSLTDEGRQRMHDLATVRRARLGRRLEGWSDADLNAFVATLARYNTSLDEDQD